MAFIQLAARRSMRDGLHAPTAAEKRLYHFDLGSVARSTVVDVNNSRPVGFFKDLFKHMYGLCAQKEQGHKFASKPSFTASMPQLGSANYSDSPRE